MDRGSLQMEARGLSPGLVEFAHNPFRILRLEVDCGTGEAAVQAERVLTLNRAGLAPQQADLLGWLPPTQIYELQQAAQKIEEPLQRLVEQLFWFDCVRDQAVLLLKAALADPRRETLEAYFATEQALPEVLPERSGEEPAAEQISEAQRMGMIAAAINQANLRLLIASAAISGKLMTLLGTDSPLTISANWQVVQGLDSVEAAHDLIAQTMARSESALDACGHWEGAVARWTRLLAHPWFTLYLNRCIGDLADDYVSIEDAESIEESIKAHLADLSAKETRFALLQGDYQLGAALIAGVAQAGLEERALAPAFRPLHHVFQSEVAEVQGLLEQSGDSGIEGIGGYLKRLQLIRSRWQSMDQAGLLGLSNILDDAVEQAYLKLRRQDRPAAGTDELLAQSAQLVGAQSLRERINAYRSDVEEHHKRLCHFCKTGEPDYDKSVVLKGTKVTDREWSGLSVTTHFSIQYKVVLRCERCAKFHDFLNHAYAIGWALLPGFVLIAWAFVTGARGLDGLLMMTAYIGVFVLAYLPITRRPLFRGVVAAIRAPSCAARRAVGYLVTPPECRRYYDLATAQGHQDLIHEAYAIEADWSMNALEHIRKD